MDIEFSIFSIKFFLMSFLHLFGRKKYNFKFEVFSESFFMKRLCLLFRRIFELNNTFNLFNKSGFQCRMCWQFKQFKLHSTFNPFCHKPLSCLLIKMNSNLNLSLTLICPFWFAMGGAWQLLFVTLSAETTFSFNLKIVVNSTAGHSALYCW